MPKIVKGTVEVDGVVYKAFENSFNKKWYVVIGEKSSGVKVATGIEVKSGTAALKHWLQTKETQ